MRKQMLGEIKNLAQVHSNAVTQPEISFGRNSTLLLPLNIIFCLKIVFPMQTTKNFSEIQIFAY